MSSVTPNTPAVVTPGVHVLSRQEYFNQQQTALLRRTICADATEMEIRLLGEIARATDADPFAGDVFLLIYNKDKPDKRKPTFIFSVNYAQKRANKAGILATMLGPYYCGNDGKWVDLWLGEARPVAAKVIARRVVRNSDGSIHSIEEEPTIVTAKSAQRDTDQWKNDFVHMLGVAARRRALRKLDVLPKRELAALGVEGSIGEPAIDFTVRNGVATMIDESAQDEASRDQTMDGLMSLMTAAGLSTADMNAVLTLPNEKTPITSANFTARLQRYFRSHSDASVLDVIDAAQRAKEGVDIETGEMPSEAGQEPQQEPMQFVFRMTDETWAAYNEELAALGLSSSDVQNAIGAAASAANIAEYCNQNQTTPHDLLRAIVAERG